MKIDDADKEFRRFLKQEGKKVTGLTPSEGIQLFKRFYSDFRFEDAQEDQGDGLACYYGLSRDGGLKYEVGLIRMFRIKNLSGAEANRRLRMSFTYPFIETIIRPGLDKVKGWPEGNKFCWSSNSQEEFDSYILNSVHIQHVASSVPKLTKLRFEKLWGVF